MWRGNSVKVGQSNAQSRLDLSAVTPQLLPAALQHKVVGLSGTNIVPPQCRNEVEVQSSDIKDEHLRE